MVTLISQLKTDVKEHFNTIAEFKNIIVKEQYEKYPKISYPGITLEELENEDNSLFFDETERVSNLGYQFTIHAEQSIDKTAVENVRAIAMILDNYLKGPRYRCLRRVGSLTITPSPSDENVMLGYLRYECSVEIDTNTIYRRS